MGAHGDYREKDRVSTSFVAIVGKARIHATRRCAPRRDGRSGGAACSPSSVSATQPAALTTVDGLGLLLFAVGFGFEVVGDSQLARFRAESDKRSKVLASGLWRFFPTAAVRSEMSGAAHPTDG
ncbi:MAG: DUF1295 domain-containing protein [Acidobacteria bacterium]|nr:DUF1295 domain-containing protein [Acidobacteriota bacterium]